MIIKEDSIFKKITENDLPGKDLLFINAVEHVADMIIISYNRLVSTLSDDGIQFRHENSMVDTWSLVDSFNRLKTLLDKITGIKKNLPWFQKLFRKIKIVEDIRNFIQHYNEKIDYLIETNRPILGYLVWIETISPTKFAIKLLCPGRIKVGELKMINPIGKEIRNKIDHITFILGDYEVNLSEMYYELLEFISQIETYLADKIGV